MRLKVGWSASLVLLEAARLARLLTSACQVMIPQSMRGPPTVVCPAQAVSDLQVTS
jgi:hypothetical protein